MGKQQRVGHDEHQHHGGLGRFKEHLGQVLETQVAVDEHRHEQRVDGRHCGGFGRSEHAAVDAAHDDRQQGQTPQGLAKCLEHLTERCLGRRRELQLAGAPPDGDHQHQAQHDARYHAGHEQAPDGDLGDRGVDHHHDRRRDQDAQRARVADHTGGELLGVAVLDHARDHDRTDRHHGGRAGARHGCEQHAGQDGGDCQTAAKVADGGNGELHHAPRHATGGHQVARKHEERNRQQGVVLAGLEELDRHRRQRILREEEDGQQAGQAQADGHRHAQCHEDKEADKQDEGGHAFSSSALSFMASAASSARCRLVVLPVIRFQRICRKRNATSA
ncbi:hypothetical protein FQZ97_730230 [compost metagenome]